MGGAGLEPRAREFEVTGREVRMLLEGVPVEPDWTPDGGLQPASDAAVLENVAAIYYSELERCSERAERRLRRGHRSTRIDRKILRLSGSTSGR